MASIQDVAKHANVGTATVSRVLSGKGYVAEKTKKKVLASIEELGYVPNQLARNLLRNSTKTIAVIVPDMSNPFFSTLVGETECALRQNGYQTLLCNTIGEPKNEMFYINMLERNMVDGIITASHLLLGRYYNRVKGPIVGIDRVLGKDIPTVCSDHAEGGRRAAELLINAGCKKVAQFRDGISQILKKSLVTEKYKDPNLQDFPFMQRHSEFEKLIREAGIEYSEYTTVWKGNFADFWHMQQIVKNAFADFDGIDGVMATDTLAVTLLRLALENGMGVPEDLKLVAYDGTYIMDMCYPTLSVVEQPVKRIAVKAVELLLKQINGEKIENMREILPVNIVKGRSTDSQ